MPSGRIKFLDREKGFGFIVSEDQEYYVRVEDVESHPTPVDKGDLVEFKVRATDPKSEGARPRAVSVTRMRNRSGTTRVFRSTNDEPSKQSDSGKQESLAFFKRAQTARSNKEYDTARSLFESALEKDKTQSIFMAFGAMERELASDGNYDRANQVYLRGVKAFPTSGKLYEDYGMLYLRSNPSKAIEIFREGIRRDPLHKILHRHLGHALYAAKDPALLAQSEQQFDLAEKANLLDESAKLERDLVRLARIPRGKLLLAFFERTSFQIQSVLNEVALQSIDLVVRPTHLDYSECYDLHEGIWFHCLLKTKPVVADVRALIIKLDSLEREGTVTNREVIFLVAQNVSRIQEHLHLMLEQPGKHPTIVPLDTAQVEKIATSGSPVEMLKSHLDEWLYKRNLYDENVPVSGRQFYGRERELTTLIHSIEAGNAIGLFGLRKVGKTSLLNRLREKRPADLVVYLDIQGVPEGIKDANYIYWDIADQLSHELKQKYPRLFERTDFKLAGKAFHDLKKPDSIPGLFDSHLRALTRAIRETMTRPVKILILFDEVERLLPSGRNEGFKGYDGLFAYIRGVSQSNNLISSIITGANPAICDTPQWEGRDNPVFQFYQELFLPPLEYRECNYMVERLGRGMGVTYAQPSLDCIYEQTGGHPFVTRKLCSRISKSFKERPLRVDMSKVEHGVQEFLFHDSDFFKDIIERLQRDFPEEKELLLFIASGVNTEPELLSLVRGGRESLRHLMGYQLVARDNGTFRVKIGLLSTWIMKYWLNENK